MERAQGNGADGVFLINHGIPTAALLVVYAKARAQFPKWWIGLNLLDQTSPWEMFVCLPERVSGMWSDRSGLDETAPDPVSELRQFNEIRAKRSVILFFGGISFKYVDNTTDVDMAARQTQLARLFINVITTSGEQTGTPPSLEKILAMRAAIDVHPLAIASGITIENVGPFLPYVDIFLVATGVSTSFTELDPRKIAHLARIIHA